jgi:hypothetical protein
MGCSREHVPGFMQYVRQDVYKDPIDWAIFTYLDAKYPSLKPHLFYPSLFQHVGDISTLEAV